MLMTPARSGSRDGGDQRHDREDGRTNDAGICPDLRPQSARLPDDALSYVLCCRKLQ